MTNLEKIQSFNADEMATFLYNFASEIEAKHLKALGDAGVEAEIITLPPELQIAIHKRYLLSEVTENENNFI